MRRNGKPRCRGWRVTAAAVLASSACAFPISAHAGSVGPLSTAVCTISQFTITTTAPVRAIPSTASTQFGVTAMGTCSGGSVGIFNIAGSGTTVGSPTCLTFAGIGGGTVTVDNMPPVAITFALAGATPGPVMAFVMQQISLAGVGGVVLLAISPASLEACLYTGTTTLSYTGISAVVL